MNKNLLDIISSNIDKNILSSLKLNEKIYDDVQIADAYLKGNLILKTTSLDISNTNNYFQSDIAASIDTVNSVAFWGLFIVKHLIRSIEKTGNEKYSAPLKQIIESFINTAENDPEIITKTRGNAAFNRTLILSYCYLKLKAINDGFADKILYFLKETLLKDIIIGNFYSSSFNASMCCAKLLILMLCDNSDCNECITDMCSFTNQYINDDGSSNDDKLASNAYFNRFLSMFVDIMKCLKLNNDELFEKLNKNVQFLQLMTNEKGWFPSIGAGDSSKSAFSSTNASLCIPKSGLFVSKTEDFYFINKAEENRFSVFYEYGGTAVFNATGSLNGKKLASALYLNDDSVANILKSAKTDINITEQSSTVKIQTEQFNTITSCDYSILDTGFSISHSYSGIKYGAKQLFILSSKCKEVRILKDEVQFFAGGNKVSIYIKSLNGTNINLCTGTASEEGQNVQVQIIEIVSASETDNIEIKVCIDTEVYARYKASKEDFLPERAYRQFRPMLTSDFMNELVRYGNVGATEIYRLGRQAYLEHDFDTAKRCEILNSLLHNCVIKSTCKLGKGTRLAYGGVGILIHADSVVGKNCMFGVGCSLAGGPTLGDYVYLAPGVRVTGKFNIGNFCVIGANAVVNKNVEPFSVVAGVPAKVIKKITPENLDRYLRDYFAAVDKTNKDFVEEVRNEFLAQYEEYKKTHPEQEG